MSTPALATQSPSGASTKTAPAAPAAGRASKLRLGALIRPHWKLLAAALIAVLGETAADLLSPWPLADGAAVRRSLDRYLALGYTRLFDEAGWIVLKR